MSDEVKWVEVWTQEGCWIAAINGRRLTHTHPTLESAMEELGRIKNLVEVLEHDENQARPKTP